MSSSSNPLSVVGGHTSRFLPLFVLIAGLVLFGCDESTPVQAPGAADKPAVNNSLDATPPSMQPGLTELAGQTANVKPIKGQYIVVFKNGVSDAPGLARRLANQKGGTLLHTYTSALRGFAVELPEKAAQALENNPNVAYVEQDAEVRAVATQNNATWGLDRIDQRSGLDDAYTYDATGSGVNVYVLDTGIRTSHNDFGGRATVGFDAFSDGQNGQDCDGHGTHVAGTIGGTTYGVAKGVNLVAVRVLDCSGSGTLSGVVAGIDWVTQNHQKPAVANMSLGGGASTSIDDAVQNSIDAGVSYAVAAGNENTDACTKSPARVGDALTVGSTTSSDSRSSFSNYGSCVDLFAPGSSITSAWYTSNSATNTISGTSMASPHVAGAAALYLEDNTGASPATVTDAITSTATTGAVSGANGSPNLLLYSPLSGSGSGGGGDTGGAPCSSCSAFSGSLSGSGDSDAQPNGTYYAGDGTETGYLEGPSSADFDLYLRKWNGSRWVTVAQSTSSSSSEEIQYNGTAGYYYWQVYSYSGSGSYTFYQGN